MILAHPTVSQELEFNVRLPDAKSRAPRATMNTVIQTRSSVNDQLCLLSVPLEVLLQITSHLTTVEYGNLRRTCKQVETVLFGSFSKEFFRKKQFMISEFSLQALVDISRSRFSSHLRHVIIGLERPLKVLQYFGAVIMDDDLRTKMDCTYQEWADWIVLTDTDHHVTMLAEAFKNLPNLQAVGMRDFNSYTRHRDYPNNQWKSYGCSTYMQNTGTSIDHAQVHGDLSMYANRVFLAIIRALGIASARPERYEVILRRAALDDLAFNLPKYLENTVRPVLSNIRTLFLDFSNNSPAVHVDIDGNKVMCANYHLRKFLAEASQLEHLRLNFHAGRYDSRPNVDDLLSWLAKPVSSDVKAHTASMPPRFPYIQPVKFDHLRELDIGMARAESKVLLLLIRKYQSTLRVISFHKVFLVESEASYSTNPPNLWARLFRQMQKLDLNLAGVNFSNISQDMRGEPRVPEVIFKDSNHPERLKWAGTDIQSGLRDFIDRVMLQEVKKVIDIEMTDTSEEDDSDVNEDEENDEEDDDDDNDENDDPSDDETDAAV